MIFSIDFLSWSDESLSGERKKNEETPESGQQIFKENSFELQPRQINIRQAGEQARGWGILQHFRNNRCLREKTGRAA
jgi:hypothetical protein